MRRKDHPLEHQSLGRQTVVTSLHFGRAHAGAPKAYVQASLHAEELPGMLAAYHLRALLDVADDKGLVRGEVVLVPVANPIGLAQRLDHKAMGRFELGSSENFNRHYPELAVAVFDAVRDRLSADAAANVAMVRSAVAAHRARWQPANSLHSLRKTLVQLAFDADIVLDLFAAQPGDSLAIGDAVAEIIDPVANTSHTVRSEVAGVMYARTGDRYVLPGDELANIAGSVPYRTGDLLGA